MLSARVAPLEASNRPDAATLQSLPKWARKKLRAALQDPTACKTLKLSGWPDHQNEPITDIPPEFGLLVALTELDLSDNQVASFPPEFGQLVALTELRVLPALPLRRGSSRLTPFFVPPPDLPPVALPPVALPPRGLPPRALPPRALI